MTSTACDGQDCKGDSSEKSGIAHERQQDSFDALPGESGHPLETLLASSFAEQIGKIKIHIKVYEATLKNKYAFSAQEFNEMYENAEHVVDEVMQHYKHWDDVDVRDAILILLSNAAYLSHVCKMLSVDASKKRALALPDEILSDIVDEFSCGGPDDDHSCDSFEKVPVPSHIDRGDSYGMHIRKSPYRSG